MGIVIDCRDSFEKHVEVFRTPDSRLNVRSTPSGKLLIDVGGQRSSLTFVEAMTLLTALQLTMTGRGE